MFLHCGDVLGPTGMASKGFTGKADVPHPLTFRQARLTAMRFFATHN